jgi:hypothetical protein
LLPEDPHEDDDWLVITVIVKAGTPKIIVVQHFDEELKRLVGRK